MNNLTKLNLVLTIIGVVLGVIVWNTANQVLSVLILIDLLVIGANITGLTAFLLEKLKKKEVKKSTTITIAEIDKLPAQGLVVEPTKSVNENEI